MKIPEQAAFAVGRCPKCRRRFQLRDGVWQCTNREETPSETPPPETVGEARTAETYQTQPALPDERSHSAAVSRQTPAQRSTPQQQETPRSTGDAGVVSLLNQRGGLGRLPDADEYPHDLSDLVRSITRKQRWLDGSAQRLFGECFFDLDSASQKRVVVQQKADLAHRFEELVEQETERVKPSLETVHAHPVAPAHTDCRTQSASNATPAVATPADAVSEAPSSTDLPPATQTCTKTVTPSRPSPAGETITVDELTDIRKSLNLAAKAEYRDVEIAIVPRKDRLGYDAQIKNGTATRLIGEHGQTWHDAQGIAIAELCKVYPLQTSSASDDTPGSAGQASTVATSPRTPAETMSGPQTKASSTAAQIREAGLLNPSGGLGRFPEYGEYPTGLSRLVLSIRGKQHHGKLDLCAQNLFGKDFFDLDAASQKQVVVRQGVLRAQRFDEIIAQTAQSVPGSSEKAAASKPTSPTREVVSARIPDFLRRSFEEITSNLWAIEAAHLLDRPLVHWAFSNDAKRIVRDETMKRLCNESVATVIGLSFAQFCEQLDNDRDRIETAAKLLERANAVIPSQQRSGGFASWNAAEPRSARAENLVGTPLTSPLPEELDGNASPAASATSSSTDSSTAEVSQRLDLEADSAKSKAAEYQRQAREARREYRRDASSAAPTTGYTRSPSTANVPKRRAHETDHGNSEATDYQRQVRAVRNRELVRRFECLREQLFDGSLDAFRQKTISSLRTAASDKHIRSYLLNRTVEQVLDFDVLELLGRPEIGVSSVEKVVSIIERSVGKDWSVTPFSTTTHRPGNETVELRLERLRDALQYGKANHLRDVRFQSLARSDDRFLPQAIARSTVQEILDLSYDQLDRIPGVGSVKIENMVCVLEREFARTEAAQQRDLPDERNDSIGASTADAMPPWEECLQRIVDCGLGGTTLGRVVPSLKSIPRLLWSNRFDKYDGLSEREITELDGHGPHSITELKSAFIAVAEHLPASETNGALRIDLTQALIADARARAVDLLSDLSQDGATSKVDELIRCLIRQIERDLHGRAADIAGDCIGIGAPPATLSQAAAHFDLSYERIRQVLGNVREALQLRWPEGRQMLAVLSTHLIIYHVDLGEVVNRAKSVLFGDDTRVAVPKSRTETPQPPKPKVRVKLRSDEHSRPRNTLRDYIHEILIDEPSGLSIGQLAERVLQLGYQSQSRDVRNVVYQTLHASSEFVYDRIARRHYHRSHAPGTTSSNRASQLPSRSPKDRHPPPMNDRLIDFLEED